MPSQPKQRIKYLTCVPVVETCVLQLFGVAAAQGGPAAVLVAAYSRHLMF